MDDLLVIALTLANFAVLALVARGVDRMWTPTTSSA
jgi:hypothetical protein